MDVAARDKDASFLERTLRDALARRLPGNVEVECRLGLPTWPATLGGVDIVFDPQRNGRRVGIETKVWDVEDAMFDLLKLASAVQYSALTMGYLVIAARPRDWARSSVVSTMSAASHPACLSTTWGTAQLLNTEVKEWRRIWQRSAARPQALPARIATFATVPVDMPRAPGHEVRIIGVTAVGKDQFAIDDDGQPTGVVA